MFGIKDMTPQRQRAVRAVCVLSEEDNAAVAHKLANGSIRQNVKLHADRAGQGGNGAGGGGSKPWNDDSEANEMVAHG